MSLSPKKYLKKVKIAKISLLNGENCKEFSLKGKKIVKNSPSREKIVKKSPVKNKK